MALPPLDVSQLAIFRTKPLNEDGFFVWPWNKFFQALEVFKQGAPQYFFDSHVNRVKINPQNTGVGSLFYETDRTVLYISSASGTWLYVAGIFSTVQIALPADLGASDAGFLANVADYSHVLEWNGTAWQWGPGEVGGGYTVPFVNPPNPITGWHAANGASVNLLQSNGGITPVTVPNTAGSFFRQ